VFAEDVGATVGEAIDDFVVYLYKNCGVGFGCHMYIKA
jgi:hypothetical protein